jgi:hypothetical protein
MLKGTFKLLFKLIYKIYFKLNHLCHILAIKYGIVRPIFVH